MSNQINPKKFIWLKVLLSYLLSGITWLIGIFYLFTLRLLINIMLVNSTISVTLWTLIDMLIIGFYAIICFIGLFVCQHFYKNQLTKGGLPALFFYITAVQIVLFVASHLITIALAR